MTSQEPVREADAARLLFVAGEGETRQVLERLRGTGLEVSSERVGTPESLKAALERPWDLAVCGAELAGLGFQEVAPLLREKALAFLVLTPRWDEAELHAALAAGAHGYLDMGRLAQVVLEVQREVRRARRQRRSELVASLNHDIRSPLNGIIGYCELLLLEEGGHLTPRGQRDLGMIKKSGKALLSLINDVLELIKIDAGQMLVERELLNFRELTEECADTVREQLEGKDVELTTQLTEQVYILRTDELKLRQVLLHLLSHAASVTPSGRIALTACAEGQEAIFTIEDTGGGIPEDELPLLFEEPGKGGGPPLGLVLARELTQVLGGSLSVRSIPGCGTTFTVRLPCLVEDEAG
ncbi:sensor histidine kinase [Archangium lipolyticum]|uniref:sensor histidine kinase n=1 Tax=Archangium lipolyticum TaxID=2970465 RepID=UPI0027D47F1D|nr:HAMP domain-containing sensor histidine kinase [Archangium lipolyticum]